MTTGMTPPDLQTGATTTSTPARWQFCPQCGMRLESRWKFCEQCGTEIGCFVRPWQFIHVEPLLVGIPTVYAAGETPESCLMPEGRSPFVRLDL